MFFSGAFIFVALTHYTLLRLPYYWDEAGYYIPAAWDFFRTGSLIPITTATNSHPPLPSVLLAAWWHVVGFTPEASRLGVCMVAAAALLGVYRLARILLPHDSVSGVLGRNAAAQHPAVMPALITALLTAIYPIWFAQSTLAHADLFAAAAVLWALSFYFERGISNGVLASGTLRQRILVCIFFSVAALSKETSVITPLALAMAEAYRMLRKKSPQAARLMHWKWITALSIPALPLAAWYAYLHHRTGNWFGDPAYVQYNAGSMLEPARILAALFHRALHLTMHMELFVPVLCLIAAMFLPALKHSDGTQRPPIPAPLQAMIGLILLANWLEFSVVGGALLTRYLLPMYPLLFIVCVATWRRVRAWWLLAVFTAAAFVCGIFINPPYGFSLEDNLAYRNFIVLQQQAIRQTLALHPRRVLTSWPASDELRKPELGYVAQPVAVETVEDFSQETLQKMLAQSSNATTARPPGFDTVLIFSTKYDPPGFSLGLGKKSEQLNSRYFGFHHDVTPDEAAQMLGATVVWRESSGGLWAAVLHVNALQDAKLGPVHNAKLAAAPR